MKTIHTNNQYMRKHIAFFIFMMLLLLILFGKANAQEIQNISKSSSYFRFGFGYGFPSASQMLGANSTYTSSTMSSTSREEGVYGSLGSGFTFNSSYVHMYSKNIGLDVSLQYLWGKKYESTSTSSFEGTTNTYKSKISSRGLLFGPSLIAMIGEGKVKPYVQVGLTLGNVKVSGEAGSANFKSTTEYRGGLSIGFKGGFGIDVPIGEKTNFFTELVFTSMSYYPKEGTATYSNGSSQQKIAFAREVTSTYNFSSPSNPDSSKELRMSMPFGSIALNVGLKLLLKKKA
ncbi:MAG: hypothetical protein JJE09_01040 [Bacteroidia bacterium]|nr:hypothetical protein [Bacteroidia bacterium]